VHDSALDSSSMSQHMHAALPRWSMELVKSVQPLFGIGKCMMYPDDNCSRLCLHEGYLIALTLLVGERPV
jgi:hypothetical protein